MTCWRQKRRRLVDRANAVHRTDHPVKTAETPPQPPVKTVGATDLRTTRRRLLKRLSEIALATDVGILLMGPTTVRKRLYAKYVHLQSPRARAAFVPVNCGAISNSLVEDR